MMVNLVASIYVHILWTHKLAWWLIKPEVLTLGPGHCLAAGWSNIKAFGLSHHFAIYTEVAYW